MISSEVPTAMAIGMPSARASAGTIRNPPPTPKNPVSTPTTSPANPTFQTAPGSSSAVRADRPGALRSHMRTATTSIKTPNRSKIQAPATR